MTMIGSNPEELMALAQQFDNASQTFNALGSNISSAIQSTTWSGNDADRFRDEWQTTDLVILHSVATDLASSATKLRSEANQQLVASGDSAGTPLSPSQIGSIIGSIIGSMIGSAVGTISSDVAAFGRWFAENGPLLGGPVSGAVNLNVLKSWFMNTYGIAEHFVQSSPLGPVIDSPVGQIALDVAGLDPVIGVPETAIDATTFFHDLFQQGWSSTTIAAGVTTIGAGVGCIPWPPTVVAGLVIQVGTTIDPLWPEQAARGAEIVGSDAFQSAGAAIHVGTSAVGWVAHEASGFGEGAVRAAAGFLSHI